MMLISLVCLLALSSTVFSRFVVSPFDNGYGSTRVIQPSVNYGYESSRLNPLPPAPQPFTNYGFESLRVNQLPPAPQPSVNDGFGSIQGNPAPQPSVNNGFGSIQGNPSSMTRSLPSDGLNAALKTAVTEVDRQNLLADEQFVFDFNDPKNGGADGPGGRLVTATARNFPALIGHGIAMNVGFLGPCGFNLPHTHPRATEFNFVVSGTFLTGLLQENGGRFIMNRVESGKATLFPQGGIHFEMNLGCEPAMFVAGFNSADPGVQTTANAFFGGLPTDIISASLGGLNATIIESLKTMLPQSAALGIEECRRRCGI